MKLLLRGLKNKINRYIVISIVAVLLASLALDIFFPKQRIKSIAEHALSQSFRREVSIASFDGNPFTGFVAKGIKVASFDTLDNGVLFEINHMSINLDLVKFIAKQDFLLSIDEIECETTYFFLYRNQKDIWNLFDFLSPGTDSEESIPILFSGKLIFKNLITEFKDDLGWKSKTLDTPFTKRLLGSATIDFSRPHQASLDAKGFLEGEKSEAKFQGLFDPQKGTYDFTFSVQSLTTNHWANYLIPVEGYLLSKDKVDIQGRMYRDQVLSKDKPFFYNINIQSHRAELALPFLIKPIEALSAQIHLSNQSGLLMEIKEAEGAISGIPLKSNGFLDFDKQQISINLNTSKFDESQIKNVFPLFLSIPFEGTGTTQFDVEGSLISPVIKGQFNTKLIHVLGTEVYDLNLDYRVVSDGFSFNVVKGRILSGSLSGNGVYINADKNQFDGTFKINDLNISDIASSISPKLELSLNNNNLIAKVSLNNEGVINQKINNLQLFFEQSFKSKNNAFLGFSGKLNDVSLENCRLSLSIENECVQELILKYPDKSIREGVPYNFKLAIKPQGQYLTLGSILSSVQVKLLKKNQSLDIGIDEMSVGFLNDSNQISGSVFLRKKHSNLNLEIIGLRSKLTRINIKSFEFPFRFNSKSSLLKYWDLGEVSGKLSSQLSLTITKKTKRFSQLVGDFELKDLVVSEQQIKLLSGNLNFRPEKFVVNDARLLENMSKIYFDFAFQNGYYSIHTDSDTVFFAEDFQKLLAPYKLYKAKLSGEMFVKKLMKNRTEIFVNATQIKFGSQFIKAVKGRLDYDNRTLFLNDFLISFDTQSTLFLDGKFEFNTAGFKSSNQDFNVAFKNVNLEDIQKLYKQYKSLNELAFLDFESQEMPTLQINQGLYYDFNAKKNPLEQFTAWFENVSGSKKVYKPRTIKGVLNGNLKLSYIEEKLTSDGNLQLSNFRMNTFSVSKASVAFLKASSKYVLEAENILFDQYLVSLLSFKGLLMDSEFNITDSQLMVNNKVESKFILGRCHTLNELEDFGCQVNVNLSDNHLEVLQLFYPQMVFKSPKGDLEAKLSYKNNILDISSLKLKLDDLKVKFKKGHVLENTQIQFSNQDVFIKNNVFKSQRLDFIFFDSFSKKESKILCNYDIFVNNVNLFPKRTLVLNYKVDFQSDKLFFDFPKYARGVFDQFNLGVSNKNKVSSIYFSGKLSSTNIKLSNINFENKPLKAKLNINLDIGKDVHLTGSLFGAGLLNAIGSQVYLTLKPTEVNNAIVFRYDNNELYFPHPLIIQNGEFQLLDRSYSLLSKYRQEVFLIDRQELISENKLAFKTLPSAEGSNIVLPIFDLKAIAFEALPSDELEGVSSNELAYQGILVALFPNVTSGIPKFIVRRYATTSSSLTQTNPLLLDQYDLDQDLTNLEENRLKAFQLLMPSILTKPSESSLNLLGEHQSNIFLRKNIRPLELGLARVFSSEHVRIDYNLGRRLFSTSSQELETEFLGLQSFWSFKEGKWFLFTQAETPVFSERKLNFEKIKLTNATLSYRLSNQVMFQIKSLVEYNSQDFLNPRLALKYRYDF